MSYIYDTIWKGVPKFLRRVDTALKNIGINERVPYNAPLIQFSSWIGGDRDGMISISRNLLCCTYEFLASLVINLLNGRLSFQLLAADFFWFCIQLFMSFSSE